MNLTQGIHSRDHRLDIFRGIALMMIFINHVPGNILEHLTSRNYGFSDAAEAFVLMSGIAVGLAYSRGFEKGFNIDALLRIWKRASVLYTTHLVTTLWAIAIVAGGILFFDTVSIAKSVNFTRLLDRPLSAMIGVPLLTHQLGYFNILPLYFVLLIVSPLYILIGMKSRPALITLAVFVWAIAGLFRFNFPNYPNPGGWFFNPFSWQLLYAVGIAGGMSAKSGEKLINYNKHYFIAAAVFLVFSLVWIKFSLGRLPLAQHLPFFIGGFDKTFLSLPRLLHALSLAYLVTNMAVITRLFASLAFQPISLMGRHGLAVFATGSVAAIFLQVWRSRVETSNLEDISLIIAGILLQYLVALFFSWCQNRKKAAQMAASVTSKDMKVGYGLKLRET